MTWPRIEPRSPGPLANTLTAAFADVVKVRNLTELSDAELAWYSLNATHQIYLNSLEHGFWIHGFKPTQPCLIISSCDLSEISILLLWSAALFPFAQMFLIASMTLSTLICAVFKSHKVWSNPIGVSTQTNMISLATAGTFHSWNCFEYDVCTTI